MALGLACVGSLLPDLDTSSSILGRTFFPVSQWIEARYPHRSVTHSLMASMAIAALSEQYVIGQVEVIRFVEN